LRLLGRCDEARASLERALEVIDGADEPVCRALIVHNLAEVDMALGHYDAAAAGAQDALDRCRRLDDPNGEGSALELLGAIERARGNIVKAIHFLLAAVTVQETIGEREAVASTSLILGQILAAQGDALGSRQAYARAQEIFTALGDPRALDISASDTTEATSTSPH
jgi:tetratricopeptide (TPR) repeat protein